MNNVDEAYKILYDKAYQNAIDDAIGGIVRKRMDLATDTWVEFNLSIIIDELEKLKE